MNPQLFRPYLINLKKIIECYVTVPKYRQSSQLLGCTAAWKNRNILKENPKTIENTNSIVNPVIGKVKFLLNKLLNLIEERTFNFRASTLNMRTGIYTSLSSCCCLSLFLIVCFRITSILLITVHKLYMDDNSCIRNHEIDSVTFVSLFFCYLPFHLLLMVH